MAIVANFNTLYFLKCFNNYFNRKIYGGENLADYISGDSGANITASIELTEEDFSLVDGVPTATINPGIPVNKNITIDSITVSGDTETYSGSYSVIDRVLTITSTGSVLPPQGTSVIIEITYSQYEYEKRSDVNFNPNEGVMTEIVINDLSFESDYLLVLDANNSIVSRWFILETVRTRASQVKLTLRRDVIYDNLTNLLSSPVFVQKGMLSEDDSFVVNDEGMSVNQIKSDEYLLKDASQCGWIIGYLAKNTETTSISDAATGITTQISTGRIKTQDQEFDMFAIPYGNLKIYDRGSGSFYNAEFYNLAAASLIARQLDEKCYDIQLLPYCPVSNLIYGTNAIELDLVDGAENVGFEYIKQTVSAGSKSIRLTRDDFVIRPTLPPAQPKYLMAYLYASDLGIGEGSTVSNIVVGTTSSSTTIVSGPTATWNSNSERIEVLIEYAANNFPDVLIVDLTFDFTGTSDQKIGVILYCKKATFETIIPHNYPSRSNLNKKEASNLQLYRFVSPNYQGSFDFNIAKNGNSISEIKAYCTYKPYTPYIKVAPEFDFLYGADYGDSRGLICGGDFSLPRVSDAWENYQLNNKNYQNIFNREIQNMDFKYNIEQRNAAISGAVGVLGAGAAGAGAGAMLGGGVGAIVGGVVGAASSGVGMAIDLDTNARMYKENKSLAVDKFNYQLGNIKALPYTLTKVGAFDISSKIWPFIEVYNCTDEELSAFRKKIQYESMTVMRIDLISNYYHKFDDLCYFKGELIRNETIAADNHLLDAIYAELMKGVYL